MSETGIEVDEFTPEPEPEQLISYRLVMFMAGAFVLYLSIGGLHA